SGWASGEHAPGARCGNGAEAAARFRKRKTRGRIRAVRWVKARRADRDGSARRRPKDAGRQRLPCRRPGASIRGRVRLRKGPLRGGTAGAAAGHEGGGEGVASRVAVAVEDST